MTKRASRPAARPPGEGLAVGATPQALAAREGWRQAPTSAVAASIAALCGKGRGGLLVFVASSESRGEEVARALRDLAPDLDILWLPPWDCLPFDRASPSRSAMGRRMAVVQALACNLPGRRVLIVSPESLAQRLPPAQVVAAAVVELRVGDVLDRAGLERFAARTGYVADDRIDEPGEIAFHGEVIDIFPPEAETPVRLVLGQGDVIDDIRPYDPISQRTAGSFDRLRLGPASEYILASAADQTLDARPSGLEHDLPSLYGELTTLFKLAPNARVILDDKASSRLLRVQDQVAEAFEARRALAGRLEGGGGGLKKLYLDPGETEAGLASWRAISLDLSALAGVPHFATARNPGRAFCDFVAAELDQGRRVVIAGLAHERRSLVRALARGLSASPEQDAVWSEIAEQAFGTIVGLEADLETGFVDARAAITVIAAPDVLGGRVADVRASGPHALQAEPDLRPGDVVLHEDHGVGVLRALEMLEVDGTSRDTLRLEYHGGATVLVPIEELGRIWRYGADEAAVTLDRLGGEGWPRRRAEVSRHVQAVAQELVSQARARAKVQCEPLEPPKAAYARFAARFAYPETVDQAAAIDAVLQDLRSGRPMDRLVCGDVGFGKTEVALRAAAAVALSGRQVAIAAPTTVLARQHFETFSRRFAGTGLKVAHLSRLVASEQAARVREGVASGEVHILVGTHALASEAVRFAALGLMVIDEEQRFGAALKSRLRGAAQAGHLLTMTATPIPRTLQAAKVGLQDVSVIATPPARRRPIRTFLTDFDPASVRTALLREKRRGGQSFFVVPRIEDIDQMAARLGALAPELETKIAHGKLDADVVDEVMVGFADGEGDILLATNIIESGLDVPRANTMFVWRPERFGLAQLHQLRGRVGRGRTQGVAYLLTDPQEPAADATRARLSTLEAFDRLGAGLAISVRDLDLRGGGDLVGAEQAGHMRMVGAALYQRVLDRALRAERGEVLPDETLPALQLDEPGYFPVDHVPDPVTRINLYARLAQLETVGEVDEFEAEFEDRFGATPAPAEALFTLARLQRLARDAGVRHVGAGPKAIALTFPPGAAQAAFGKLLRNAKDAEIKGERILVPSVAAPERFALVERLLNALL